VSQPPRKPDLRTAPVQVKPREWSARSVPKPAPGRSTADPRTPTRRELAARAAKASVVADAARVVVGPEDVRPVRSINPLVEGPAPEPQTLPAKMERLAKRRALIADARARAAEMPVGPERARLLATAARFEDDTRAVDRMRLAKHVYDYYGENAPAPLGYTQLKTPEDLARVGLTPRDLAPVGSNFRATVYRSQLDPGAKPIVAYRGTVMESLEDWKNNVRQGGALESAHYNAALRVGDKLASRLGPDGFETAGHSLGGGMASAVSAKLKVRGDIFNAAGVSEATLRRVGASRADGAALVNAYSVDGEILTALQNAGPRTGPADTFRDLPVAGGLVSTLGVLRDASGQRLAPDALGRKRTIPAVDAPKYQGRGASNPMKYVDRHLSPMVLSGFEQEKSLDSRALGLALRR
jgi:hypothetical protein